MSKLAVPTLVALLALSVGGAVASPEVAVSYDALGPSATVTIHNAPGAAFSVYSPDGILLASGSAASANHSVLVPSSPPSVTGETALVVVGGKLFSVGDTSEWEWQ